MEKEEVIVFISDAAAVIIASADGKEWKESFPATCLATTVIGRPLPVTKDVDGAARNIFLTLTLAGTRTQKSMEVGITSTKPQNVRITDAQSMPTAK